MTIRNINRYSKLFQPMPKNLWSTSEAGTTSDHKLMAQCGIIKPITTGVFAILPLGLRSLNKLINIVDTEMENIGAQKLVLPSLIPSWVWKKTDRYQENKSELFTVHDRHNKEYLLCPVCMTYAANGEMK